MTKCSYCGGTLKKGSGIMFVNNKGQIFYFCSSKCRKYYQMERKKGKWITKK
jgi:large subunit ribosomal protein L24e